MAKGNMFLGYSRGSVGDVTFSRVNGQQVQRARNRNPKNPRTLSQVKQRERFSSAVDFYKYSIQNFFKFAFEGKRERESDFNAFMRENSAQYFPLSREKFASGVHFLAPWVISRGSLPALDNVGDFITNQQALWLMLGKVGDGEVANMALVESRLKSIYGLLDGDIVTCYAVTVLIDGDAPVNDANELNEITSKQLRYGTNISQLVIGNAANAEGWNIEQYSSDELLLGPEYYGTAGLVGFGCVGCAFVVSRNTANGLKVSNAALALSPNALKVYDILKTQAWQNKMLQSDGFTEDAILQGSIAKS